MRAVKWESCVLDEAGVVQLVAALPVFDERLRSLRAQLTGASQS